MMVQPIATNTSYFTPYKDQTKSSLTSENTSILNLTDIKHKNPNKGAQVSYYELNKDS